MEMDVFGTCLIVVGFHVMILTLPIQGKISFSIAYRFVLYNFKIERRRQKTNKPRMSVTQYKGMKRIKCDRLEMANSAGVAKNEYFPGQR